MKSNNSVVTALLALVLSSSPVAFADQADLELTDRQQNQQLAGLSGGALAGGLVAGPPGAIIGGLLSVFLLDQHQNTVRHQQYALDEKQRAVSIHAELDVATKDLVTLERELLEAQESLSNMLAQTIEVTRQRDLLQSLEHEVRFDTDKAELTEKDLSRLLELAHVVSQLPNSEIRLEGYADVRGDDDYNETLSLDRAYAVADAMQSFGVAQGKIRTFAYGESEATAVDLDSLQQDRRVRIQIAPQEQLASDVDADDVLSEKLQRIRHFANKRRTHSCDSEESESGSTTDQPALETSVDRAPQQATEAAIVVPLNKAGGRAGQTAPSTRIGSHTF